jgi:sugar phosphate isomerase/epimerase
VDALKKLQGRIISLHFKDINAKSRDAHDVIWGTGVANVPGVLQELKNQRFKGVFSIEYEYNWDNSVPDIDQSLKNFREITARLK